MSNTRTPGHLYSDRTRTDTPVSIGVRVRVEEEVLALHALRQMWRRVPTKGGRPSIKPTFIAVTECPSCHAITLTTSHRPQAGRWRCRNVLVDGPCQALLDLLMYDGRGAVKDRERAQ